MTLRPKLLLINLLTAGLPLFIGLFLLNRLGSRYVADQEGRRLQISAEYLGTALQVTLHEYVNDLHHWSEQRDVLEALTAVTGRFDRVHVFHDQPVAGIEALWPTLAAGDPRLDFFLTNRMARAIRGWQSANPLFQEVIVTDAAGRLMAASNKSSDFWQADEAWWREGADIGPRMAYVEGIQYDESAGVYSLDVMVPVRSPAVGTGTGLVGVVKGVLDAGPLISAMSSLSDDAAYGAEIVLPDGRVLARFHEAGYSPMSKSVPGAVREAIAGGAPGWFLHGRGAAREFRAHAGVKVGGRTQKGVVVRSAQPFTLVVKRGTSDALDPLYAQVRNFTIAGAVLVGLLLFLADRVMVHYVARPILRLRTATGRLNLGPTPSSAEASWLDHLAQQVHEDLSLIRANDEMQALARDFGAMTDRIIRNEQELLRRQRHLEGDLEARSTEVREVSGQLDERKRDLAQMVNQLEQKNRDLEAFAYIASHDLKAPLRAVGSIAGWLGADYAEKLDESGRQMLDLLVQRVERMDRLINGILEYSRAGNVSERERVAVSDVVDDVLFQLERPEGLAIEREGPFPEILTNRIAFGQILQNLVGNAIKYMDKPDGHIRVGARRAGEDWEFSVSDNGPGIDPKYHDRIFKIFSTLHSRDDIDSTGIGLTVVKRQVEALGGRVWAEETPGGGTTFRFTHPASPA